MYSHEDLSVSPRIMASSMMFIREGDDVEDKGL